VGKFRSKSQQVTSRSDERGVYVRRDRQRTEDTKRELFGGLFYSRRFTGFRSG